MRNPRPKTHHNIVQDYIEFAIEWLERRSYALTIDTDMERWARTMSRAEKTLFTNPTFDPQFNVLSPHNSFWIDIRAGAQTIATSAARLFADCDFLELTRSTRLWFDPPRAGDEPLALFVPPDFPAICGEIGHEGGLWVHPDHRKRGLSTILPHLNRALCYRQWDVDWQTGMMNRQLGESGIGSRIYGFPHIVPCFEGKFLITRREDLLFLAYMDRQELLAGLDPRAVSRLLADGDSQMANKAVVV